MKTLCLLLAFTSPALAGSIMFGASWDGNPPGTFADIAGGGDFESGHADFAAGTWIITVDGGYSAWVGRDVVGFEGDTFCATAANPCALGGVGTVLQVYQDRPWRLWATTPSFTHLTSNGPQFAFTQTSQTSWRWGLEDIGNGGDGDYQDVIGSIQFLHGPEPIPTPTPQCVNCDPQPTPVPEPSSLWLIGVGMLFLARANRG
jgi:hypothetical protein